MKLLSSASWGAPFPVKWHIIVSNGRSVEAEGTVECSLTVGKDVLRYLTLSYASGFMNTSLGLGIPPGFGENCPITL